jgi:hypothetical protein
VLLVPRYPGVLHFETRAKFAIALPKMSRSSRSLAFSARSLASSICSGLTGLSPAPLSWPLLATRTQLYSAGFGVPSILAVTAAT